MSESVTLDKKDFLRACALITAAKVYLEAQPEATVDDEFCLQPAIELLDMAEDAINGNTV